MGDNHRRHFFQDGYCAIASARIAQFGMMWNKLMRQSAGATRRCSSNVEYDRAFRLGRSATASRSDGSRSATIRRLPAASSALTFGTTSSVAWRSPRQGQDNSTSRPVMLFPDGEARALHAFVRQGFIEARAARLGIALPTWGSSSPARRETPLSGLPEWRGRSNLPSIRRKPGARRAEFHDTGHMRAATFLVTS